MPDKKLTDSEMERLYVSQCSSVEWCEGYNNAVEKANVIINRLQAENERLNKEIDRLLNTRVTIHLVDEQIKTAKAEAYKECIEKVEKKMRFLENRGFSIHYVVKNALINLSKELVGDN